MMSDFRRFGPGTGNDDLDAVAITFPRLSEHFLLVFRNEDVGAERRNDSPVIGMGSKPRRNPMPPPKLARPAPGLDILHPVEAGLLPFQIGRAAGRERWGQ